MSSENNEHMVERVARAIYGIPQRWPNVEDSVRDTYRADARRALEASHHAELVEALRRLRPFVVQRTASQDRNFALQMIDTTLTKIGANQ